MSEAIALIACTQKKLPDRSPAYDLYTGTRFKLALGWVARKNIPKIFVLSAKYGLISSGTIIDPYDESLHSKTPAEIVEWAKRVMFQLEHYVRHAERVHVLAEDRYVDPLRPYLRDPNVEFPLAGLDENAQKRFLAS